MRVRVRELHASMWNMLFPTLSTFFKAEVTRACERRPAEPACAMEGADGPLSASCPLKDTAHKSKRSAKAATAAGGAGAGAGAVAGAGSHSRATEPKPSPKTNTPGDNQGKKRNQRRGKAAAGSSTGPADDAGRCLLCHNRHPTAECRKRKARRSRTASRTSRRLRQTH